MLTLLTAWPSLPAGFLKRAPQTHCSAGAAAWAFVRLIAVQIDSEYPAVDKTPSFRKQGYVQQMQGVPADMLFPRSG